LIKKANSKRVLHMDAMATPISGLLVLTPYADDDMRGFFCEVYNKRRFTEIGIETEFVQDNLSLSVSVGTLRGLHFQNDPMAQAKLVGVVTGAVRDVVVDLRQSSSTFGTTFSVSLNGPMRQLLFVPPGCAHGFITHEPNTLFAYKVSNYYSPEHDTGIRFDDPILSIDWGRAADTLVISERDRSLPHFDPSAEYFS
jgi:dTDP-4-dehydrorhamnose 3,5-epimerase